MPRQRKGTQFATKQTTRHRETSHPPSGRVLRPKHEVEKKSRVFGTRSLQADQLRGKPDEKTWGIAERTTRHQTVTIGCKSCVLMQANMMAAKAETLETELAKSSAALEAEKKRLES